MTQTADKVVTLDTLIADAQTREHDRREKQEQEECERIEGARQSFVSELASKLGVRPEIALPSFRMRLDVCKQWCGHFAYGGRDFTLRLWAGRSSSDLGYSPAKWVLYLDGFIVGDHLSTMGGSPDDLALAVASAVAGEFDEEVERQKADRAKYASD